jgi:hypothetical protein
MVLCGYAVGKEVNAPIIDPQRLASGDVIPARSFSGDEVEWSPTT